MNKIHQEHAHFNSFEQIKPLVAEAKEKQSLSFDSFKNKLMEIAAQFGLQASYNALLRSEVILGWRKPSLAIFDHTWHIIGGGQKYGFTIAHALKECFDITLIANRTITHDNIKQWYHLDLSECAIKVIPIPFFDAFDSVHLDPARISFRTGNPFHAVSKESGNYDFFINNSMNEKVMPLSNVSSLICHFPERRPKDYFYANRYTHVVYNSQYTAGWIEKKWKFTPHKHIYPPVDMAPESHSPIPEKENIILSVARFEEGGSKKQLEMVQTFLKLNRRYPELMKDWRLVLAGGSANPDDNSYLNRIKEIRARHHAENIELLVNCPGDVLKEMYRKARVFWHLCGLDQSDPALVEHFGMTIVEAMQNALVPIVFDGGGQREIVLQGDSGFRVSSTAQLMSATIKVLRDQALRSRLMENAKKRSFLFTREVFEDNVRSFYRQQLDKYIAL